MSTNVPPETPGQAINNMTDGRDDPKRGPIDRMENVIDGRDDPNRGPIDRLSNTLDGRDDPTRGPIDRAENALGGSSAFFGQDENSRDQSPDTGTGVVSAVFDTDDEARSAIAALRSAGVDDASLSLITQRRGTTTTANADGDVVDEEHTHLLRGILGGGALGAGLGVAALAIPGVGPLVAAGAIAATAVPGAMAIGAAAGAALGSLNEVLKAHGVSDEDAAYYGERMNSGGVLVTVNAAQQDTSAAKIQDILYQNGGHNTARARSV
jgi:hypothetical protein